MKPEVTELVRYDAMCRAIDAAHEIDEVKEIRDRALALELYARLAVNTDAERRCCEIRLRAEDKAGALLRDREMAKGGGDQKSDHRSVNLIGDRHQTLADLGISKNQSSQWQKLNAVPRKIFEAALAGPDRPSTAGIIAAAAEPKLNPVSEEALWIWGRLRDFDRDGLLEREPSAVLCSASKQMMQDISALAPRVADWLLRIKE